MYKRPPLKKRHTKPCKFFQTNRCTLSAQDCDFAHILSIEMSAKSSTPCWYFAAGHCVNGSRCRFNHVSPDQGASDNFRVPVDGAPIGRGNVDEKFCGPDITWLVKAARGNVDPDTVRSSGYMNPWYIGATQPIYSPPVPVATRMQVPPSNFHHDVSRMESTFSASTSSSSSSDEGFASIIQEDMKYGEQSYQHSSQPDDASPNPHHPFISLHPSHNHPQQPYTHNSYLPPLRMLIPSPLFDPSPVLPHLAPPAPDPCGAYAFHMSASPVSVLPTAVLKKGRSKAKARQKSANYKTKPCRYFRVSKTCPNGLDCTFIHDEPGHQRSSIGLNVSQEGTPVDVPRPLPPGLPLKPVTLAEENKKRNYFPISWRVIGGGVLIGDPKSCASPVKAKAKLEPVELGHATTKADPKSIPIEVTRTRSSSNPSAPTNRTQLNSNKLFSAESPGNL